jgi:hypothetical protein
VKFFGGTRRRRALAVANGMVFTCVCVYVFKLAGQIDLKVQSSRVSNSARSFGISLMDEVI